MDQISLKSLVGKLNDTCRRSLEGAAGLCLSRTNYNVEIEHWLLKLIEAADADLAALFRYYEVDVSRLAGDLTRVVDRLKTGNARPPALSPHVVSLVREAWMVGSIEFGAPLIRSGYLLCALLSSDTLSMGALDASREFEKISPESLRKDIRDIVAETAEAQGEVSAARAAAETGAPGAAAVGGKTPSLDQFTVDLTVRARQGDIDPVLGRDAEIRQIVDILTRRRQNNPILTGEAGVGKTAVVEGFALRVAAGDVPPALKNVSIRTLDLGLLQAGAGIKGEFENRLKSVIEEVKASPRPIILFIDEAHTMIGAGGQAGQGDAANLLKPALARGELRTIAATTWAEYKKYFEKDAALARRFQVVKVEEPTEEVGVEMMRGLVETLENHHKVRILDEAVVDTVRLSNRYISGRQLPDKAVSLLDTASARVAIGHTAVPPAVEDCRRRIDRLGLSIEILERENLAGAHHQEQIDELAQAKSEAEAELEAFEAQWKEELELVGKIRTIREQLERGAAAPADGEPAGDDADGAQAAEKTKPAAEAAAKDTAAAPAEDAPKPLSPEEIEQLREQLEELTGQLKQRQGETPLMQVCVDSQAVAEVVSGWTGIPVGRMVTDEIRTVLSLKELMEERIIGQSHALEAIAQSIRTSRASLTDPRRPIGVFLLVGPSGVGKTETAVTLAELLYGGDQNMTVINMSEFKEEHKVSLLMGSPPGYVGYGEGGVLTEAVRRRPYSVVLLDEMEKAHSGVQDIFYQVFDKGMLRDGEGRDIDFRNTVILMTSNAGTDLIMKLCADPMTCPDAAGLAEALHPELLNTFKPAFLGRVTLVPYFPLTDDVMQKIVELQLDRIRRRVVENHKARFEYDPELLSGIAQRCTEVESGARNIDHILTRTLLPELSAEVLARMADEQPISAVKVSLSADGAFEYAFS